MSDHDLKPCPFCGAKAVLDLDGLADTPWSVTRAVIECSDCDAEMVSYHSEADSLDAIKSAEFVRNTVAMWNKRVLETKQKEKP